jgi:clan AA aspartic protease (TIGR02281 family)
LKTGAPIRLLFTIIGLSAVFLLAPAVSARADTLYLKDGRKVEGVIRGEDQGTVKLGFEFGDIEFNKEQIERIERSTSLERNEIRLKWSRQKPEAAGSVPVEGTEGGRRALRAGSRQKVEHISVNALLNGKVPVKLLLDTGATYVVLSSRIGRRLGVLQDGDREIIQLQIGDGRKISAHYFNLKSISIEGTEAKDVGAAVLLEDEEMIPTFDGVLGMSFLNRFNFKVDQQMKRLIFEEVGQAATIPGAAGGQSLPAASTAGGQQR